MYAFILTRVEQVNFVLCIDHRERRPNGECCRDGLRHFPNITVFNDCPQLLGRILEEYRYSVSGEASAKSALRVDGNILRAVDLPFFPFVFVVIVTNAVDGG